MNDYTLGKYQYSSGTIKLAAALFVGGMAYGIFTGKNAFSAFAFGLVGSIAGFSIGAIITPPKRVIE